MWSECGCVVWGGGGRGKGGRHTSQSVMQGARQSLGTSKEPLNTIAHITGDYGMLH